MCLSRGPAMAQWVRPQTLVQVLWVPQFKTASTLTAAVVPILTPDRKQPQIYLESIKKAN